MLNIVLKEKVALFSKFIRINIFLLRQKLVRMVYKPRGGVNEGFFEKSILNHCFASNFKGIVIKVREN